MKLRRNEVLERTKIRINKSMIYNNNDNNFSEQIIITKGLMVLRHKNSYLYKVGERELFKQ